MIIQHSLITMTLKLCFPISASSLLIILGFMIKFKIYILSTSNVKIANVTATISCHYFKIILVINLRNALAYFDLVQVIEPFGYLAYIRLNSSTSNFICSPFQYSFYLWHDLVYDLSVSSRLFLLIEHWMLTNNLSEKLGFMHLLRILDHYLEYALQLTWSGYFWQINSSSLYFPWSYSPTLIAYILYFDSYQCKCTFLLPKSYLFDDQCRPTLMFINSYFLKSCASNCYYWHSPRKMKSP